MKVAPVAITIGLLAAIAGGGYWYWTTTPLYALQSLMMAVQNHDGQAFSKRVDVEYAVENMLEDMLVYPALSTPNLSAFQKQVATGAIAMAKKQIKQDLLASIYRSLAAPVQYGDGNQPSSQLPKWNNLQFLTRNQLIDWQMKTLEQPAYAADNQANSHAAPVQQTGDVKDLLNVASHELGGEVGKLKSEAFQRMQSYVRTHPDTIPGRVINAPATQRGAILRRVLEDHGFSQNYFKGLTGYKIVSASEIPDDEAKTDSSALPLGEISITTGNTANIGAERALVGLRFYNYKLGQEVIVEIEMMKGFKATNNSVEDTEWCVTRLANLRPVLDNVAQDYLNDVHELIAYSLSGMNNQNINKDMRGITDRIKNHPAAQNFLKKLGI
ncbi:hypothetical protein BH11CYA1_BH11CYA1_31560 [soil metagenome]